MRSAESLAVFDRLQRNLSGLVDIVEQHEKCLRCHCFREVAERGIGLLARMSDPETERQSLRLEQLLASQDGTHG